jgi:hypothetical protein
MAYTFECCMLTNFVLQHFDRGGTKFDRTATRETYEVVVMRFPDCLLVVRVLFGLFHLSDDALRDKDWDSPINGGPGNLRTFSSEPIMKRLRVKVTLHLDYSGQNFPPSRSLAPAFKRWYFIRPLILHRRFLAARLSKANSIAKQGWFAMT